MYVPVGPSQGYAPGGVVYGKAGRTRPAHPAVKKTVATRPVGQQADPILQLVQQILALQTAPLKAAEAQRQAQIGRQQADMQAAQKALVAQLQQGAQTGGQAYDQAAAATDALGRQGASYFQSQNPNAQTQANLKAIGAPVAQQQALGNLNQSLFNGGPGYVLGAQIPGASLQAQKAAQVSYLAGLPTVAALQGQTGLRSSQLADQAAHQGFVQDLMKVTAQTPQLVQAYRAQYVQQANAARAEATRAGAALANARYLAAKAGLAGKQLALATTKEQHQYDIATRNADTAETRAGSYADSVTNTNTNAAERNRIADENAQTAKTRAANAATVAAGKNRTKARRNAGNARVKALNDVNRIPLQRTINTPADPKTLTPAGTKKVRRDYGAVKQQAMNLPDVQLLITRYGYSRAQVSQIIDKALAGKGIRPNRRRAKNASPGIAA